MYEWPTDRTIRTRWAKSADIETRWRSVTTDVQVIVRTTTRRDTRRTVHGVRRQCYMRLSGAMYILVGAGVVRWPNFNEDAAVKRAQQYERAFEASAGAVRTAR
jgi:hypothetical protein